jgi:hypothetical protein
LPNPDGVADPEVDEFAAVTEPVHRGGAHPQPIRHLAHRKQSPCPPCPILDRSEGAGSH